MDVWIPLLLPFVLLLGRVTAFIAVLPVFSHAGTPMILRAGMALALTVFFAMLLPAPPAVGGVHWAVATWLLVGEILCGLALGLAARLVYLGVQQAGRIIDRQMGFAIASIVDPATGEQVESVSLLFEITFLLFFLAVGGHRLLILIIGRSYEVFPAAATPNFAQMAEAVTSAGSEMLLFALKLSAPMLAAFIVLSVVLGILARVLPEMNILLASFPLRIGLGLLMAAALMPAVHDFAVNLAHWLSRYLIA
jgi:flagellar biosynthetic protein FliR